MAKATASAAISPPLTLEALLESKDPQSAIAEIPFEQAMLLLEQLVTAVERGTLPLEASIQSYERGALLVTQLRHVLSGAEARLKLLSKNGVEELK